MENFDGFLGMLATAILSNGLSNDTTILVVVRNDFRPSLPDLLCSDYSQASEDIGNVAAGVFQV
jgi:hypothetical protein